MGQGLYRCVGWGCLNPPQFDWDEDNERPSLYDAIQTTYEAKPDYIMIPFGVDDEYLQTSWSLPSLPEGLPHIEPRTAVTVPRCEWWPDIGKTGVWVSSRVVTMWEMLRVIARPRGFELPEGEPVFVCEWD